MPRNITLAQADSISVSVDTVDEDHQVAEAGRKAFAGG